MTSFSSKRAAKWIQSVQGYDLSTPILIQANYQVDKFNFVFKLVLSLAVLTHFLVPEVAEFPINSFSPNNHDN